MDYKSRFQSLIPKDPYELTAIAATAIAIIWIFGDDLRNLAVQTRDNLRSSVRDRMPFDAELERARTMTASLMPDLRRNHEVIVREQIEVEELRRQCERDQDNLDDKRDAILQLRARMKSQNDAEPASLRFDENGTPAALRARLRKDFAIYQTSRETLAARQQVLQYREDSLNKAESVQRELLQKKKLLESQIEQLQSKLQLIRRDGIESDIRMDQNTLGRCDELLLHLRKRLHLSERMTTSPEELINGNDELFWSDSSGQAIESAVDTYFLQDQK